ncbi:hypothetical protein BO71DRAFT_458470, partial [Aspergillus ellipticus CBS 707.79]
ITLCAIHWKSLLLFTAIAELTLAHAHHPHGHAGRARRGSLAACELVNETVVDTHTIIVTETITGIPPTSTTSGIATTTTSDIAASVIHDLKGELDISVSLSVGLSTSFSEATNTSTKSHISTASSSTVTTSSSSSGSYTYPTKDVYSTSGFGERSNSTSSSGDTYVGNVGVPWGSNIIEVSASEAWQYKYVVQFTGRNTADWFVGIWNKIGPNGADDGFFGHSALNFMLAEGATRYSAFDENTQGGWGAAEGTSLPTNKWGEYSSTWGELDFGDEQNDSWSGWDVSAIVAMDANQTVQGMKLSRHGTTTGCSYITSGGDTVSNAYTPAESAVGGMGGTVSAGLLRLAAILDYSS